MCAQAKPGPGVGKSPLEQFEVSHPLQCVAVDISGPWPITDSQNEYIVVVCDYYTKWTEAYAAKDHTAQTVADLLCVNFFSRFGCPTQLHSDQGREFESKLFSEICTLLGITKTRTNPYRPQSDGLVERINRTIKQMIRIFVNQNNANWDELLPYLLMAYRSTEHASTRCTPNILMLGRQIKIPLDLMVGPTPDKLDDICQIEYAEWLQKSMNKMFQFVFKNTQTAATRQKTNYDKKLKPKEFKIGQWVWRWYLPEANKKLGLGWKGPYLVINKITNLTYTIQPTKQGKSVNVHVDHLKPYECSETPENWLIGSVNPAKSPIKQTVTRTGRTIKPRKIYSP